MALQQLTKIGTKVARFTSSLLFYILQGRTPDMVAYEFYWRDEIGKEHLVGILPERRKNLLRITKESILNWVSSVIGDNLESNKIYFVQVEM
jgi:hypothetical protein